jgi:CheY-like chemotaxis protein
MTTMSAASTRGNSWNRLSDANQDIQLRLPPSLATLGLPQGRVLVVVEDAVVALDIQRLLHEAGYRVVGPATTLAEVQRMIERGDIDCAILDHDLDRRAPLPIADVLAFAEIPFVYLAAGVLGFLPPRHKARPVVEKPFTREALVTAVEKAIDGRRAVANDNRWGASGFVVPWARVYPSL